MPSPEPFFSSSLHQLRDFRLFLPNPTFGNRGWSESGFHVLILRLSPFADVERSTPHLFLAREVRAAIPDGYIDMAFLPCPSDARLLAAAGLPLVIGTQSRRALGDFDLVLVSNSWLLEQVNLPYLLLRSGVPCWASLRGEEWPPIILGGSNSAAAHALVSETGDSMADAVFFGEGEGSVGRIARLCRELAGMPKRERLTRVAGEVPGLWPAGRLSGKVRKASCAGDEIPADAPAPVLPGPESTTARITITRGCPCRCSFCFESHDRKPFREVPSTQILKAARKLKQITGADTLEIESFNFNTHADMAVLLERLNRIFLRVNLMSQRVDILARTPGLLELEIAADKRSFTLGIEGISGRLRAFFQKSLEDADLGAVLEAMHARRMREIKLFYLLAGRETREDLEEFAAFVKWLKQVRSRSEAPPRIVFSFGMLVRMPFTPLRHDPPVLEEPAWRPVTGKVKSICETNGFEFRLAMNWPVYAATQALALGGHSLHLLLEKLAALGSVTDEGLSPEAEEAAREWITAHRSELEGEKPRGQAFPFPFLDDGDMRDFLHRQYEDAKEGRDAGYCRRGVEECAECPGCTLSPPRDARGEPRLAEAARALRLLMQEKHRLKPLYLSARLPRDAAGLGSRWAEAWLMRALLERHPRQIDNILAVRESMVDASGVLGADAAWFGQTVVGIMAWDTAGLGDLADGAPGPFGAVIPDFTPGSFRSMRVRLELPVQLFPEPADNLAAYLRDQHAPVTLSRRGGALEFQVRERSLKKRMLLAGWCEQTAQRHTLELDIGPKPFLGAWLESIAGAGAARRALMEISNIA